MHELVNGIANDSFIQFKIDTCFQTDVCVDHSKEGCCIALVSAQHIAVILCHALEKILQHGILLSPINDDRFERGTLRWGKPAGQLKAIEGKVAARI